MSKDSSDLLTINEAASYFTLVQRKYVMSRLLMQSCSL